MQVYTCMNNGFEIYPNQVLVMMQILPLNKYFVECCLKFDPLNRFDILTNHLLFLEKWHFRPLKCIPCFMCSWLKKTPFSLVFFFFFLFMHVYNNVPKWPAGQNSYHIYDPTWINETDVIFFDECDKTISVWVCIIISIVIIAISFSFSLFINCDIIKRNDSPTCNQYWILSIQYMQLVHWISACVRLVGEI